MLRDLQSCLDREFSLGLRGLGVYEFRGLGFRVSGLGV